MYFRQRTFPLFLLITLFNLALISFLISFEQRHAERNDKKLDLYACKKESNKIEGIRLFFLMRIFLPLFFMDYDLKFLKFVFFVKTSQFIHQSIDLVELSWNLSFLT